MKITANDLLAFGVIEEIMQEPQGGAHRDLAEQAEAIKEAVWRHLQDCLDCSEDSSSRTVNEIPKIGTLSRLRRRKRPYRVNRVRHKFEIICIIAVQSK